MFLFMVSKKMEYLIEIKHIAKSETSIIWVFSVCFSMTGFGERLILFFLKRFHSTVGFVGELDNNLLTLLILNVERNVLVSLWCAGYFVIGPRTTFLSIILFRSSISATGSGSKCCLVGARNLIFISMDGKTSVLLGKYLRHRGNSPNIMAFFFFSGVMYSKVSEQLKTNSIATNESHWSIQI